MRITRSKRKNSNLSENDQIEEDEDEDEDDDVEGECAACKKEFQSNQEQLDVVPHRASLSRYFIHIGVGYCRMYRLSIIDSIMSTFSSLSLIGININSHYLQSLSLVENNSGLSKQGCNL